MFKAVTQEEILTTAGNGKVLLLDGEQISQEELKNLSNEAKVIESTMVYKIITNTLRLQASRKMFEESKSWEDMIAGKMMLYSIGVIENIIKILSK